MLALTQLTRSRLESLHRRCVRYADEFPSLEHCVLRSDDAHYQSAIAGTLWDAIPGEARLLERLHDETEDARRKGEEWNGFDDPELDDLLELMGRSQRLRDATERLKTLGTSSTSRPVGMKQEEWCIEKMRAARVRRELNDSPEKLTYDVHEHVWEMGCQQYRNRCFLNRKTTLSHELRISEKQWFGRLVGDSLSYDATSALDDLAEEILRELFCTTFTHGAGIKLLGIAYERLDLKAVDGIIESMLLPGNVFMASARVIEKLLEPPTESELPPIMVSLSPKELASNLGGASWPERPKAPKPGRQPKVNSGLSPESEDALLDQWQHWAGKGQMAGFQKECHSDMTVEAVRAAIKHAQERRRKAGSSCR